MSQIRKNTMSSLPFTLPTQKNIYCTPRHLYNGIQNNPLSDYLDLYGPPPKQRLPFSYSIEPNSYAKQYMKWGNQFENYIRQSLEQAFPHQVKWFVKQSQDLYSPSIHNEVRRSIQQGIPILYQVPLYDTTWKVYGIADLLVRHDYLPLLFPQLASQFSNEVDNQINSNYVVIEIKFTSINMTSDGYHIRNSPKTKYYKAQSYLYNQLLRSYQPNIFPYSFLLGQDYIFHSKHGQETKHAPFSWIGWIEPQTHSTDKYIPSLVQDSLTWCRELRSHGKEWSLFPRPSHPRLYPNPKIQGDEWNSFQTKYAMYLGDITQLVHCTPKQRDYSFTHHKIESITQLENVKQLGISPNNITGKKLTYIFQSIQYDPSPFQFNEIISPTPNKSWTEKKRRSYIQSPSFSTALRRLQQDERWKRLENTKKWYGFDLEFSNTLQVQWNTFDLSKQSIHSIQFLIGLATGYKSSSEFHGWMIEKEPLVEYVHLEKDILESCLRYLSQTHTSPDEYFLLTWGEIELIQFRKLCHKYPSCSDSIQEWIIPRILNIEPLFSHHGVVFPGGMDFKLKTVVRQAYKYGFIHLNYSSLDFQSGSQVGACLHERYDKKTRDALYDYNRVDCQVMLDLVHALQRMMKYISSDKILNETKYLLNKHIRNK